MTKLGFPVSGTETGNTDCFLCRESPMSMYYTWGSDVSYADEVVLSDATFPLTVLLLDSIAQWTRMIFI